MTPAGWTKIENEVLASAPDIGATAVLVYAVLKSHRNGSGDAWPSIARIASLAGLSERAVRAAIRTLEAASMINVEARRDPRGGSLPHQYTFPLASPQDPAEQSATPGRNETPGGGGTKRHQGAAKSDMEGRNKAPGEQEQREQEPGNKTKKGTAAGKPVNVEIPPELNTPQFVEAWRKWIAYRRERRLTVTAATIKAQLAKLAAWGVTEAVASIDASIAAGWQGLFPATGASPNGRNNRNGHTQAAGTTYNPARPVTPL